MNKIKLLNFILFLDFVLYIFSNLIIFKNSPSNTYSIFAFCVRDIIIFLFSISIYIYFCNSTISSLLVFPKINSKIIKNSIIIGISFYLIASGINLIFTRIFKFTLKSTVYLNSIHDISNLGFGFIVYIFIYTIFSEIFFRGILNDVFKMFNNTLRIVLSSLIFSFFFFGLSQIAYGFVIGVLLMNFLERVGNIALVIISSLTINISNYFAKIFGDKILGQGIGVTILSRKSDVFTDLLFPIIVILVSFIVYSIFRDKMKIKPNANKKSLSNVTEVNFNNGIGGIVDIYFILFIVTSVLMLCISYFFLG